MPFDLEKPEEGTWFPFMDSKINTETGKVEWLPVDPNEKERVCFRTVDPDVFLQIKKKYQGKKEKTPVLNPETRSMELITTWDQTPEQTISERREFWDQAITGWEIWDPSGNPIPCTPENKFKAVQVARFIRYANRCLELLSGESKSQSEAEQKN